MSEDLINWRIEKAQNTYQEGLLLLEADKYEGAVNRFYYAVFHGMRAVLATKGYDAPKHSGVISLFNKHFVKPGYFSKQASKIVTIAFSERSNADYNDYKTFQKEEVDAIKDKVNTFLEEVKDYLANNGYTLNK